MVKHISVIVLIFLVSMFAAPVVARAQDQSEAARIAAGCGPAGVQFDVKTEKNQHPAKKAEDGKALVYVIQDETRDNETFHIGAITTRVGLDGKWMGANHGFSYFFFEVDPGEHRLCSDWQSSFKRLAKLGSAITFNAEPGKTYYFRIAVEERKEHPAGVKLEAIDSARGDFLIASHALATPKAKEVARE